MTLTKADLKDAALFLKAGRVDVARKILNGSNDPRAVALLTKLDALFPPEPRVAPQSDDGLKEIKRLIVQKKFDEAETLLRVSNHPKAQYLLDKIALKKSPPEIVKPHLSILNPFSAVLTLLGRKGRQRANVS